MNLPVIIEGNFDRDGVLVAKKLKARPLSSVNLSGTIESLDGNLLMVAGTAVYLTATTVFEDHSTLHLRTLTGRDLRLGDYVKVAGASANPDWVVATTLQRKNPPRAQPQTKGKGKAKSVQAKKA